LGNGRLDLLARGNLPQWRDGIRFLTGEALQPSFKRQSRPLGQSHGHLILDKVGILLR